MVSSFSFLEAFAEFIVNKFGIEKLCKELKIILPNNFSCTELKSILTDKYKVQNLPLIISFGSIISQKDSSVDYTSKIEELFILSGIITEYKELKFTTDEALKAAESLNKLFADLIISNIDIKLIETYNNSEYWQKIYRFLEYCFLKWQEKLAASEKQSRNNYKLKLLSEEITRTKNSHKQVILAGIFKPNSFLRKYEEELQKQNIPLIKYDKIAYSNNNISYYEPTNIYEEAEQIGYICNQNIDKKIAIIINNDSFKKIYCNSLNKYSLVFKDLRGNDLRLTNISELLTSIIKILCHNFDLKLLFLLLKNPLINCSATQELELMLSGKNRFISSANYLLQLQFDNEEVKSYCHNLVDILFTDKPYNIKDILVFAKEIAEKFLPDIWTKEGGTELLEFLSHLMEFSNYINSNNKKDFLPIFAFLLSNVKYYKNTESMNIIIGTPEDLALSCFDLVILPHFNNQNWHPTAESHPYLSKKAKQILNIDYDEVNTQLYSDYFNLLLQNKEVIILNAKKYDGKLSTPCNLFLKLSNKCVIPRLDRGIQKNNFRDPEPQDDRVELAARSTFFPNILSVTDIETLIRSPYGFYAKKILGLRKKDNIWEEPKISDFGNFIHKVLEKYSKNYDKQYITLNLLDKQNALINTGNRILYSTILPTYTKKTWQMKLILLSKAFILFDIERRQNCQEIYFEIKGELKLNIADQDIKIIGIADRIEISKSNKITILDYKTGTIPTKKEIELGLSPQLIIESLMILENGFAIKTGINKDITIAYVKITSTDPYIQTTEISLSKEVLDKHKKGLIRLLEYYVTNKSFVYDLDLLRYNDYLHLMR